MNFIENKFLALYEKKLETLFLVSEYISSALDIDDFYLNIKKIFIDSDTCFDELNVKIVNTNSSITIFGYEDDIGFKLPELDNVFLDIINTIESISLKFPDGLYYSKSFKFQDFLNNNN